MQIYKTEHTEQEMCVFAVHLAKLLKPSDCLCFHGNLGAGKTTFIRAMIQHLVQVETVPSPTFTLVQTYDSLIGQLWHFDLYRIKQPEELYELGFEEALAGGILFIEWPDHAKGLLPVNQLQLHLDHAPKEEKRVIKITGDAVWANRLAPLNQH
ncbi:MAG: tRNA (adenosine(37)-N6)-threonylcarbamoyltransferase complex ATPase subunit type 1 TsaE [Alphaproteobacteria bacterium]|nr:tRNA (adenosine(37)-N6)-threonylcarbamoyltransferase complex ATPase subunit type 1 TsaE [Alphaproteobacteria bacterium]